MDRVIVVDDLRKVYKPKSRKQTLEVKAVDGISFEIERGEFFGLLGPNGAGKTTTIGILTTRVIPTGGRALVDGIDVRRDPVAVKRRIGFCPQVNNLDRRLLKNHDRVLASLRETGGSHEKACFAQRREGPQRRYE